MSSQAKLNIVLKMTKEAMDDIGLQWNPKKCNVLNVRRGVPVDIPEEVKSGETVIDSLKEDTTYRFLGAPERLLQEEKLALQCTSKTYLQRLSVIWSSPLSDTNKFKRPISLPCQCCRTLCGPNTFVSQTCATSIDRHGRSCVRVVARTH